VRHDGSKGVADGKGGKGANTGKSGNAANISHAGKGGKGGYANGTNASAGNSNAAYVKGQDVAYFSASNGAWIPTKIADIDSTGGIQLECKAGHWFRTDEEKRNIRAGAPLLGTLIQDGTNGHAETAVAYARGQDVVYYSASNGAWIPTKIADIDSSGGIQLECKAGHWFRSDAEKRNIRLTPPTNL
jgi:hypothetical protein